jgi:hypothetical protein
MSGDGTNDHSGGGDIDGCALVSAVDDLVFESPRILFLIFFGFVFLVSIIDWLAVIATIVTLLKRVRS